MYEISFSKPALKELKKLPKSITSTIVKDIESLKENPFPNGVKKLQGLSNGFTKRIGTDSVYRIRSGDYRILYAVFEKHLLICVLKVVSRKDIYRLLK